MRTASRQDIVSGYRAHNRLLMDIGAYRAYAKGLRSYPDMPFEEQNQFASILGDHAVFFQGVFALHEAGTLEDETYQAYLDWFACHLSTPGGSALWAQYRSILTPRRMIEAVDARLTQGGLPDVTELPLFRSDALPPTGTQAVQPLPSD